MRCDVRRAKSFFQVEEAAENIKSDLAHIISYAFMVFLSYNLQNKLMMKYFTKEEQQLSDFDRCSKQSHFNINDDNKTVTKLNSFLEKEITLTF